MTTTIYTLFYNEYEHLDQWIKCCKSINTPFIILYTGATSGVATFKRHMIPEVQYALFPRDNLKYDNWDQSFLRNKAIEICEGLGSEWVLQMDIDETISSRVLLAVNKFRKDNNDKSLAYAMPTMNLWSNGEVRVDSRFFPDWHYRLFHVSQRYTEGNRHLTLKDQPEVRNYRLLTPMLNNMLCLYDTTIIHWKYMNLRCENNKYRCLSKDYSSIKEVSRGAMTIPISVMRGRYESI